MKNYIGFVNDHSGSMSGIARAAMKDYNANILAIKNAATREQLDTIVSVVGIGLGKGRDNWGTYGVEGFGTTRQVVVSNPHVLRELKDWPTPGGTPLYDGIGDMINLFKSLPDYNSPDVSFLVMVTTDGEEQHSSIWTLASLQSEIRSLQNSGRWTFVLRIPRGQRKYAERLGVPADNIQEWDTTAAGMAASTVATTQAVDTYFTSRASGMKSSNVFYANANNVTTSQVKANLVDISSEITSWPVLPEDVNAPNGKIEIKPFCEKHLGASPYLKGAAFYQLSKTEPVVQADKLIIIRDKATGRVYQGDAARDLIGLPRNQNARIKVGDFGSYDIFIQSKSINRHLVEGTQVLYWAKIGEGFKPEDFPWLNKAQNGQAQHLTQAAQSALAATAGVNSPVVKPAAANATTYYQTRGEARAAAKANGKSQKDAGEKAPRGQRWYIG